MINRSAFVRVATVAGIALAALGTASVAQAGGNVAFSIGANIAPGVSLGISSAPYYGYGYAAAPVYVQPAPVYYAPAPVYYQPAPVYYAPAVYYSGYYGPRVVTYRRGYGHGGHRH